MFQIHKLPQHDFWSLHVKKVHSSWTWQMHRCTAHSIINCFAATTPPTQPYQQQKILLYFWPYSWKSTEYFPHTHVKKRVVLMEYTALMKGQSCTSLNWKIREKTNFFKPQNTNSDTEFDPFITSTQCCNYQILQLQSYSSKATHILCALTLSPGLGHRHKHPQKLWK